MRASNDRYDRLSGIGARLKFSRGQDIVFYRGRRKKRILPRAPARGMELAFISSGLHRQYRHPRNFQGSKSEKA
jgi:hypothetical protein